MHFWTSLEHGTNGATPLGYCLPHHEDTRAFIAVAVVGVFMLITGFMALFLLLTKAQVDLKQYADFFAKTASVDTGIIGVIVGYYFATVEGGVAKKPGVAEAAEANRVES